MPYRIGGVAERANVAGRLTSLVNDISRSRRGRPIRWLEDGGMFHLSPPQTMSAKPSSETRVNLWAERPSSDDENQVG
jgi:hypothetical protein